MPKVFDQNKTWPTLCTLAAMLLTFSIITIIFSPTWLDFVYEPVQQFYMNVSWHFWKYGNWLVPHDETGVYIYKPPMQFWLTTLLWSVFGVKPWTLRIFSTIFAILTTIIVTTAYNRLYPKAKINASLPAIFLLGSYYFFHTAIYYKQDMLLTCFTALTILGVIEAGTKRQLLGWLIFTAGSIGALLTKGPVVWLYALPIAIIWPYFDKSIESLKTWYIGLFSACVISGLSMLIWLIPLSHALDLKLLQYIKEVGFSHNLHHSPKPWYRYFILLPTMLLIWTVHPYFWKCVIKFNELQKDWKMRLIATSILIPLIIMTLIPAKESRYIMPLFILIGVFFAQIAIKIENKNSTNFYLARYRAFNLVMSIFSMLSAVCILLLTKSLIVKIGANMPPSRIAFTLAICSILWLCLYLIRTKNLVPYLLTQVAGVLILTIPFATLVLPSKQKESKLRPFAKCLKNLYQSKNPMAYYKNQLGYLNVVATELPPGPVFQNEEGLSKWRKENSSGFVIYKIKQSKKITTNGILCDFKTTKKNRYFVCPSTLECEKL